MNKLVQFGAGNIGRSLVGQLFSRAGWKVVFVDAIPAIVDALNERGGYLVRIKDKLPPGAEDTIEISGVSCLRIDDAQGIGKRYRRQDEIGTPFCVTVDFDTLDDQAVTVRERDTMSQERVALDKVAEYLGGKLLGA